jgi:hypothetical protein
MSTSRQGAGASDFVTGLQDAIRQNPVSAALVGMGVLWMFTGGSRITAGAALFPAAAKAAASGVASGLQRSAEIAGSGGESLRSFGASVAEGVRDAVSGATDTMAGTAKKTFEAVKDGAVQAGSQVKATASDQAGAAGSAVGVLQQNLKATFERQPLLLGAIGLAIGASMATAVPATKIEEEMIGEASDRVQSQMKDFASAAVDTVTETAQRTYEAVKDEAAAQGLTLQDAREGVAAVGNKVKTVAQSARG